VKLIGLREFAETLGISLSTARRWAGERKFRVVRLGGRVLVPAEEADALISRCTVAADALDQDRCALTRPARE